MAIFGRDIVKLVTTKAPKKNNGIQGDREMRVKRNGKLITKKQ